MSSPRRLLSVAVLAAATLVPAAGATAAPGTLSGSVSAPGGAPLEGICVDVHEADDLASFTRVTTVASGDWSLTAEEGDYRIKFVDCASGTYASEWFDDAASFAEATTVTLTPGGRALPDVELARANRINGRVVRDGSGTGVARACIVVTNADAVSIGSDATADANGNFSVRGLPDGDYIVSARDCRDRQLARSFYGPDGTVARGPDQAARVTVAGGTTTSLTGSVVLRPQAVLTGVVTDAGGDPLAGICVGVSDTASSASSGTTTAADGSWRVGELLPGTWEVKLDDCRPGLDDTDVLGSIFIDPNGGSDIAPIRTTIRPGGTNYGTAELAAGGVVSGRVTGASSPAALTTPTTDGRPAGGVCVGAVAPGTLTIVDSTITSAAGTYRLPGLLGGAAYRIVFFDCDEQLDRGLEWYDDELLGELDSALTIPAGGTGTADAALGAPLRRVDGENRRDTANQLALAAYPDGADVVLLARQDSYPDALAGGPLAAALGGPVLLAPSDGLTPDVVATIRALDPGTAYILGGPVALAPTVEQQLADELGLRIDEGEVFRFNGTDRFDTAAKIANILTNGSTDQAYVVEGSNPNPRRGWPDAVSVSGLAAFQQRPILLVNRDDVPAATSAALRDLGVDEVTVVGGPVAVAEGTFAALDVAVDDVVRVFGETRYDTSAAVVDLSLEAGMWMRSAWIATGENFPDALVAGGIVGRDGGVLQLLPGSDVESATTAFPRFVELLQGNSRTILLGGPVAISEASEASLATALGLR